MNRDWDEKEHPRDPHTGEFVDTGFSTIPWYSIVHDRMFPSRRRAAGEMQADEVLDSIPAHHDEQRKRFVGYGGTHGDVSRIGLDTKAAATRALSDYAEGGGEYTAAVRADELTDEERVGFQAVQQVFDRSRLQQDVLLLRGISSPKTVFGEARNGSLIGHEWVDPGLVSTSAYWHGAQEYMSDKRPMMMEIFAPEGTPAIHLFLPHPRTGEPDEEKEVVLPPGLRYRVTGDEMVELGGREVRWLTVEIVP